MLHYVTLGTNDLARSAPFYEAVLATLGLVRLKAAEDENGYGHAEELHCGLWVTEPFDKNPASIGNGSMVALVAASNGEVDAFHKVALERGGKDEGAPGYRYRAGFYACYVRDLDGNKLSAVCENPV